jgi:V-type H+-transporting ATPase subunit H
VRANLLSASEAGLMKSIEKQSRDKRVAIVEKSPQLYATTIVELLSRITRDDVVKYILSLAGDFAAEVPEFTKCLLENEEAAYSVLVKLLDKNDEQIHLLSAKTLVVLMSIKEASNDHVASLFSFLSSKLASSPNSNLQDIAVQSYGLLLRTKPHRSIFWNQHSQNVPPLLKILSTSKGSLQLQYHTLIIFWLISFEATPCAEAVTKYDLTSILLDITKNAVKEKITRVSTATLVNTVKLAPKVSINTLLYDSALPLVKTLSERKWADDELINDLQELKDSLQEAFDSMSTFDEYKAELESKKLKWSPPHRSELFWKDNAFRFKEVDWKMIKLLDSVVSNTSSTDSITLAVACNDISRIITELPESLKVMEKLGTKIKIMELMNHSDSEVRYQSLKATQNFISHSFK